MTSLKRLKKRNKDLIVFDRDWEPTSEEELVLWMMKLAKRDQVEGMTVKKSGNWRVFAVCNHFLQTKVDLIEATHDLVTRMAIQHYVNYIEIRFAPVLHTNEGLTEEEVVYAVIEGFHKAKADLAEKNFVVDGGLILCALRSFPVAEANKTVKLIQKLNNDHVLGFDIAGDEGAYPLKLFEDVIKLAIDSKIKVTVHAGEWHENKHGHVMDGIRLAVELGVNRIGHGLALRSINIDNEIFAKMIAKNISVEICLTSNCDNFNKCVTYSEHPLTKFVANNLPIAGLNVDNLLLAGNQTTGLPDPSGEFARALLDCGLSHNDLLELIESSYRAAFKPLTEEFINNILKVWEKEILPILND